MTPFAIALSKQEQEFFICDQKKEISEATEDKTNVLLLNQGLTLYFLIMLTQK